MSAQPLTFVPWLINEVETAHHPGLQWTDAEHTIMRIPWPRASEEMSLEELGVIFCWHRFKNGETHIQNRSPSNIKGNFRAILNTRDELKKLRGPGHKDPNPSILIQLVESTTAHSASSPWSDDVNRGRLDSHDSGVGSMGSPLDLFPKPSPLQNQSSQQWPDNAQNNAVVEEWLPCSYPTFAQQYLNNELQNTGPQCQVWLSFKSRGRTLYEKQCRIDGAGLLIYSDMFEADFTTASSQERFGTGAIQAEKLFIPQLLTPDCTSDTELQSVLENFSRGLIIKSDQWYNVLAQRNCKVKAYFGHGNQATVRHMARPSRDQGDVFHQIYNYRCFIEMAAQYKERKGQGAPCNASDQPTYLTLISLGQEWTPFTPISSLPFYIEVYHDRGAKFHFEHLQEKVPNAQLNNIIVSLSNSVDRSGQSAMDLENFP